MLRRTTKFHCDKCGNTFTGPDVEWNATVMTAPQPCPKCGTMCKSTRGTNLLGVPFKILRNIAKTILGRKE